MAVKRLKSGAISVYTANTVDASSLKEQSEVWVNALGSRTTIFKPTYGGLAYAVRMDKKSVDPGRQPASIGRDQTENVVLHLGATATYVSRDTENGAEKIASSLVVEYIMEEEKESDERQFNF